MSNETLLNVHTHSKGRCTEAWNVLNCVEMMHYLHEHCGCDCISLWSAVCDDAEIVDLRVLVWMAVVEPGGWSAQFAGWVKARVSSALVNSLKRVENVNVY